MNKNSEHTQSLAESHWKIRSTYPAFIFRGFELILLTFFVITAYHYFPNLNFFLLLVAGVLIVTSSSFVIYKIIQLNGKLTDQIFPTFNYKNSNTYPSKDLSKLQRKYYMKNENIILRILGLILLGVGIYWFWKISDFALVNVWGIPLPLQIILIVIGFFTLVIPSPFLRILALFLPKEQGEKVIEFINTHLDNKNLDQITIQPEDKGSVLAEKLNYAIFLSKRRFYVGALIALIIFPLVSIYIFRIKEDEKTILIRHGNLLIERLKERQIGFTSFDEFRSLLDETKEIKKLSPKESSIYRIYEILEQIYDPTKIKSDADFNQEIGKIYKREVSDVFNSGAFDIKKIEPQISSLEPPRAKQTYYMLLAIICNTQGDNGKFVIPHLYERGILNELFKSEADLPSRAYNLDGVNYSSLLKSTRFGKLDNNKELVKSVFSDNIPRPFFLAIQAKSRFEKYNELTTTNQGKARYLNNIVDLYLTSIYLVRVKGEEFKNDDPNHNEFVNKILEKDLTNTFVELGNFLNEASKKSESIVRIIETTRAQLFSIEGEVKEKDGISKTQDAEWCQKQIIKPNVNWCSVQREKAVAAIKTAISNNQSKEVFSESRKEESFLDWLWKDENTANVLREITK